MLIDSAAARISTPAGGRPRVDERPCWLNSYKTVVSLGERQLKKASRGAACIPALALCAQSMLCNGGVAARAPTARASTTTEAAASASTSASARLRNRRRSSFLGGLFAPSNAVSKLGKGERRRLSSCSENNNNGLALAATTAGAAGGAGEEEARVVVEEAE